MDIIRAEVAHVPLIAPLFDGYRQFYEAPSDLAGATRFIHDRLSQKQSVIFLAMNGATAVGFTQLYPLFSSVSMTTLWLLNDLFVSPLGRQQGVGEALLKRAEAFGREVGAKGLALQTAVTNLPAQRLYERCGWVRDAQFYWYDLSLV